MGGLSNRNLFSHSWRWEVQDWGDDRVGFFWDLSPWLADGCLFTVSSCSLFSAHSPIVSSSSYKDTSPIAVGPYSLELFGPHLITSLKAPSPNKVTLGFRNFTHDFMGDAIQSIIASVLIFTKMSFHGTKFLYCTCFSYHTGKFLSQVQHLLVVQGPFVLHLLSNLIARFRTSTKKETILFLLYPFSFLTPKALAWSFLPTKWCPSTDVWMCHSYPICNAISIVRLYITFISFKVYIHYKCFCE